MFNLIFTDFLISFHGSLARFNSLVFTLVMKLLVIRPVELAEGSGRTAVVPKGVKKGSRVYPEGHYSFGSVDLYWWRPSIPDTVVV